MPSTLHEQASSMHASLHGSVHTSAVLSYPYKVQRASCSFAAHCACHQAEKSSQTVNVFFNLKGQTASKLFDQPAEEIKTKKDFYKSLYRIHQFLQLFLQNSQTFHKPSRPCVCTRVRACVCVRERPT